MSSSPSRICCISAEASRRCAASARNNNPGRPLRVALSVGPRKNMTLEGLTLTPSGEYVFASMKDPGYNDGNLPTPDAGALTRITRFDVATGKPSAQYAYPLDPIPAPNGEANGLSDLVALDDENFLVIERSHGTHNVARVYRASIAGAENILGRPSLVGRASTPMTKNLLADLSTVPRGAATSTTSKESHWGPSCPTGAVSRCSSPTTTSARTRSRSSTRSRCDQSLPTVTASARSVISSSSVSSTSMPTRWRRVAPARLRPATQPRRRPRMADARSPARRAHRPATAPVPHRRTARSCTPPTPRHVRPARPSSRSR